MIGTLYLSSFILLTVLQIKITYFIFPAVVLMLAGMFFILHGMKDLGSQLLFSNGRLVTEGIYSRVRHPIYLGILFLVYSSVLATLSIQLIIYALLLTLAYSIIIPVEERYLLKRFGEEYKRYKARVPALLPGLKFG